MEKEEIIKEIMTYHPGHGTDHGWSWYVGGMRDTGDWYSDKLREVREHELEVFLCTLKEEQRKVEERFKESQRISKLPQEEQERIRNKEILDTMKAIIKRNPGLQSSLENFTGIKINLENTNN